MKRQPKKRSKRGRRRKKDEKQTTKEDDNDNDNDLLREENLDLIYYGGVRSKTEVRRNRPSQSEKTKIENHIPNNHPAGSSSLSCDIIIYDILTRIPIESLLPFRRVCKEWTDLIWDPLFIDLYSRRSYNPPSLIYNPPWNSTRLTFFDINKKKKNKIIFPRKNNDFLHKEVDVTMLYSLNGLLLLSCYDKKAKVHDYRVLNPITGLSMILPKLIRNKRIFSFSMVYDSITSKYKVVCLGKYSDYDVEHRHEHYVCKIFTLGRRVEDDEYSWRDVVVPKLPPQSENYYLTLEDPDRPVFANGSLHWMMQRQCVKRYSEERHGIFRFDVSSETFSTIRFPNKEGKWAYLHEMGGLLCFVDEITSTKFKLWVLKEVDEDLDMNDNNHNKKKHEWTKECDIDMGHLEEDDPNLKYGDLFAILAHPTQSMKLIFRISPNGYESDVSGYFPYDYYSYDTKLKQFHLICELHEGYCTRHCFWHVNSLSYF